MTSTRTSLRLGGIKLGSDKGSIKFALDFAADCGGVAGTRTMRLMGLFGAMTGSSCKEGGRAMGGADALGELVLFVQNDARWGPLWRNDLLLLSGSGGGGCGVRCAAGGLFIVGCCVTITLLEFVLMISCCATASVCVSTRGAQRATSSAPRSDISFSSSCIARISACCRLCRTIRRNAACLSSSVREMRRFIPGKSFRHKRMNLERSL